MQGRGWSLDGGEIRLKQGKHRGPNKGFGAAHIWAEHSSEMMKLGLETLGDVPAYVAMIVRAGTAIYCEFDAIGAAPRLAVVQSRIGKAILEYQRMRAGLEIYSVVTAFSNTKAHGTRVGTVR